MIASDSSTNLAWLINQNTPSSRIDNEVGERRTANVRTNADFGSMTINPELLERSS
jgi:hypothetical protein